MTCSSLLRRRQGMCGQDRCVQGVLQHSAPLCLRAFTVACYRSVSRVLSVSHAVRVRRPSSRTPTPEQLLSLIREIVDISVQTGPRGIMRGLQGVEAVTTVAQEIIASQRPGCARAAAFSCVTKLLSACHLSTPPAWCKGPGWRSSQSSTAFSRINPLRGLVALLLSTSIPFFLKFAGPHCRQHQPSFAACLSSLVPHTSSSDSSSPARPLYSQRSMSLNFRNASTRPRRCRFRPSRTWWSRSSGSRSRQSSSTSTRRLSLQRPSRKCTALF